MQLIAHRGLWNKNIKDNSYEALKNGLLSNKYIGIECDIRTTLDKKIIIYHNTFKKRGIEVIIYGTIKIKKDVKYIVDDYKLWKYVIKNNNFSV